MRYTLDLRRNLHEATVHCRYADPARDTKVVFFGHDARERAMEYKAFCEAQESQHAPDKPLSSAHEDRPLPFGD